jgi:hypothetical protein
MAIKAPGPIFRRDGKVPTGTSIIPSEQEIKDGIVEGPWMINYKSGTYPIVDAIMDPLAAIGLKKKKPAPIEPAPRAPGYSGKLTYNSSEVGDVAYKMIRNEIEADGYNVVEVSAAELERISPRYKSPFGAEDSDVGGKNIYIVKDNSSEMKTEVAYHEWFCKRKAEETGRPHYKFHDEAEKEQDAATESYMRRAMEALFSDRPIFQ